MTTQVYNISAGGPKGLPLNTVIAQRDPQTTDVFSGTGAPYQIGQWWQNSLTGDIWVYKGNGVWEPESSGIQSVTVNTGSVNPVIPNAAGNINILGTGIITTTGTTNTVTISANTSTLFTSIKITSFATSGTYTADPGMDYCIIEVVGSGGAGGGAALTGMSQVAAGSGGGGGEYRRGFFTKAAVGVSQAVTIGAAGAGVAGMAGGNGAACSVGTLIIANGGTGGNPGTAGSSSGATPGAGGTGGSGGQVAIPGGSGNFSGMNTTFGTSGYGGSTVYGAISSVNYITNIGTFAGTVGSNYGGGGSGAWNSPSQGTALAGGNGATGLVIITEFI
jgi:hypothetical protein